MEKYSTNKPYKNIFYVILLILLLLYIVVKNVTNKNEVINDYSISTGKIINYYIVGEFDTPYLTYEYSANGIKYLRKINSSRNLDSCYMNIEKCDKYKFLVLYSNKDHKKSLINISRIIKDSTDFLRPININDFE